MTLIFLSTDMNRIVSGDDLCLTTDEDNNDTKVKNTALCHERTYRIASNLLTQFACMFTALINNVNLTWMRNPVFVQKCPDVAATYRFCSVAEQRLFDISWALFMDNQDANLRTAICDGNEELNQFQELVINGVMATNLLDPDLKKVCHI